MTRKHGAIWTLCLLSLILNAGLLSTNFKVVHAQSSPNSSIQTVATQFATAFQNKDAQTLQSHVETVSWPQFQGLVAQPGSLGVVKAHSNNIVTLDNETAYFPVEWTKANGQITLHFVTVKKRGSEWKVVSFK